MTAIELRVDAGDVSLAGTLHLPMARPAGAPPPPTLLMVGGSGPTTRDNDVYFPPIRERLLARGIAVASFDKRGVGASTGDWFGGGPDELTRDALAEAAALRTRPELDPQRIGLFGHSQGGWVVLDAAAADPAIAWVITNSGPGVTPAVQERYSVETGMRHLGDDDATIAAALARFDEILVRIRAGAPPDAFADLATDPALQRHTLVPTDADVLRLMRPWIDHDPRPALERLVVPFLAVFGTADRVVPVEASLAVMRAAREGRPGGMEALLIEGGDHRCQVGEPPMPPETYHAGLADWILRVTARPAG